MRAGWIILCLTLVNLFTSDALSQSTQTVPSERSSVEQGQENRGAKQAIDFVELRQFLEQQAAKIVELQRLSEEGSRNAEVAPRVFDETIAAYRDLIESVGSKSENVRRIEAFAARFEEYANDAGGSANKEVRARADALRRIANEARQHKRTLVQESNRAYAQIAALEKMKEVAVYDIRIGEGQKVLASYRAQIDILIGANDKVNGVIREMSTLSGRGLPQ